jgi:hypothetical protein
VVKTTENETIRRKAVRRCAKSEIDKLLSLNQKSVESLVPLKSKFQARMTDYKAEDNHMPYTDQFDDKSGELNTED